MRTVTTLFAAASLAAVLCGEYAFAQRHEVLVDAHGKDVKD